MVIAYIRNLPISSNTVAALRGGEQFRGWDNTTYMLANLIDAVQDNTYAFIRANSKRPPKRPSPIERPKSKQVKKNDPSTNKFMGMARLAFNSNKKKQEGR